MKPTDFTRSILLATQLADLLSHDAESKRIIQRLLERIHLISLEHLTPAYLAEASKIEEAPDAPSPLEVLSSLAGALPMVVEGYKKYVKARGEYIEFIDTNREYITALESRVSTLLDELNRAGVDTSRFPQIEKP